MECDRLFKETLRELAELRTFMREGSNADLKAERLRPQSINEYDRVRLLEDAYEEGED
jgi:hypothetical protein